MPVLNHFTHQLNYLFLQIEALKYPCKIIHDGQRVWMLKSQHPHSRLPDLDPQLLGPPQTGLDAKISLQD